MKKILTVLIFFLFTNTAIAKEYIMTCNGTKYKLVSTFFSKKLQVRKDAQWQSYCIGEGETLEIYDDGAMCNKKVKGGKDVFLNGKWDKTRKKDDVISIDFYLKTLNFNNRVTGYRNTIRCRN